MVCQQSRAAAELSGSGRCRILREALSTSENEKSLSSSHSSRRYLTESSSSTS